MMAGARYGQWGGGVGAVSGMGWMVFGIAGGAAAGVGVAAECKWWPVGWHFRHDRAGVGEALGRRSGGRGWAAADGWAAGKRPAGSRQDGVGGRGWVGGRPPATAKICGD